MLTTTSFHVQAWSAWTPGLETKAAWRQWANLPEADVPASAEPVPVLLRRRVSPLGQRALQSAWSLAESATARMVFCSRHGEFGRTVSILDSLIERTEVSPSDFTLSVHNGLLGLLSIARANHHGHTMIAAGAESFGFGMLEALACLAEHPQQPVLLVHYDEPLPAPFDVLEQHPAGPLALALALTATNGERFSLATSPPTDLAESSDSAALAFMQVMLGIERQLVWHGEQLIWHWRRHHAPA
jgi:hypothetical protein